MQTISEIHHAFLKGTLSPVELTESYLKRNKEDPLNLWITRTSELARGQAQAAEALLAKEGQDAFLKKPLLGIPIGIKDIFTTKGVKTTCASRILEHYVPPYTATCIDRLFQAGAVCLGKLNMDEFAMGSSNEHSAFGPVRHPTHPDRVPGGSSGASAAAVKANQCVVSIGTDTGGSIRLPASFCGVVGMKPTYGSVSRYGLIAFASSLDQAGPMSHCVEDSARVLEVLSGPDPKDATGSLEAPFCWKESLKKPFSLKNIRIGVVREFLKSKIQAEIQTSFEKTCSFLKAQGAQVSEISLPHVHASVACYYIVAVSEASSNLSRYDGIRFGTRPSESGEVALKTFYQNVRTLFGSEVKRRILLGTFALSSGYFQAYYLRACQVRRKIQEDFQKSFEKVDLICTPVAPTTAFELGAKAKDPLKMYLTDLFTIPVNLAGLPALSVPIGKDASGLPIGLQCIGGRFQEGKLFSFAREIEHAFSV